TGGGHRRAEVPDGPEGGTAVLHNERMPVSQASPAGLHLRPRLAAHQDPRNPQPLDAAQGRNRGFPTVALTVEQRSVQVGEDDLHTATVRMLPLGSRTIEAAYCL